MRRLLFLTLITAALVTTFGAAASRSDRFRAASEARDERKADMLFLEALRHKEHADVDAYADLIGRAYEINPADSFLGWEYGRIVVSITQPEDSDDVADAYAMMRDYAIDGAGDRDFYIVSATAQIADRLGYDDDARLMFKRLYEKNPSRPEVAANYAQRLALTGRSADIAEALAVYDTIEAREGLSIPLTGMRMRLRMLQGDTLGLLAEARRLMESSPETAEYAVMAGDVYSQMQRSDSALIFYNKAIELDPTSGIAYYSRANYYLNRGDSSAYDREIFLALGQQDLDVETKTELMRDYVSHLYRDPSQQDRISQLFSLLIDEHPHESAIHGLYADYLAAIGNYSRAAEQADYQIGLDPSDANRWRFLGSLYLSLKDYGKAAATARKAMEYFPEDTQLPLMAAAALSEDGKPQEAITLLAGVAENPDFDNVTRSEFLTSMGDALYKDNRLDSAFVYYDRAIKVNPANYLAMNNCAYFLACSDRDLDQALQLAEKAVAGRPDDPTTLDTYAWVLFKRHDYDKAREVIDHTIELATADDQQSGNDLSAELLEHAGDIYFMVRQPEKALDYWKQALELDPDSELLRRKVTHKTYFYE